MADYLTAILERYESAKLNSDPRTTSWLLAGSPWPMLAILVSYLLFVKFGKQLMEKRNPIDLTYFMMLYNFGLVLLSFYIATELVLSAWQLNYNVWCDPVDYSTDPKAMRLASALWWYYISKHIELLDTVIFILRKKYSQVTVLHVYHHSTMIFLWWIGVNWYAGGSSFLSATVNSYVHVVMYTYYFLSGFGDLFKKYLWWKKYITMLQLGQFFVLLFHTTQAMIWNCDFDYRPMVALFFYLLSHIVLFSNFYSKAYNNKKPKQT